MSSIKRFALLCCLSLLASCSTPSKQSATSEITIFSINDFHGNLQADKPVPYMAPITPMADANDHDHDHAGAPMLTPSGGYAYLAAMLKQRRAAVKDSILVGAGDLIGASPIGSAILRDEPVIEGMNQLGLSVTSVGNHEFDNGGAALKSKLKGECPEQGCSFPGFHGATYDYLAANVSTKSDGKPWMKPYVIRQIGDVKVAFIGAVTVDTPNLVAGDGVKQLRFEDEASAINRSVPEIKQQGVSAIVLLIHEGAYFAGAANDPSYQCAGLKGPIIDIVKKLDKAISLVVSGHTHQGYTCMIDGRMVVQARSYGAYLTETTLTIDRGLNRVIHVEARNHLIEQAKLTADPAAQRLVDQVTTMTGVVRNREVGSIGGQLTRASDKNGWDSSLGNVIADAQLNFAKRSGTAELALINGGSIRSDLPGGNQAESTPITFGDLYAAQPFGNSLVSMSLSGAQIMELLQQQWHEADQPKKLFVSHGFSYRWDAALPLSHRVQDVRLNSQPLQPERQYKVIVNSFLAGGGDGFTILKQGTQRQIIGQDIEALEAYVREQGSALSSVKKDRVLPAH